MDHLKINRPKMENQENLYQFFEEVIKDTFAKEGLGDLYEDIENEIESKKRYLNEDFESSGETRFFLIALINKSVVGTIEYGRASLLIDQCTDGELKDLPEIGTVFVHPDYQRQGIGNLLLKEMFAVFKNKGIEEFCLDSGYTRAQKIWKKKFGEPDYFLKDFWGEGKHHLIWKSTLSKCYNIDKW